MCWNWQSRSRETRIFNEKYSNLHFYLIFFFCRINNVCIESFTEDASIEFSIEFFLIRCNSTECNFQWTIFLFNNFNVYVCDIDCVGILSLYIYISECHSLSIVPYKHLLLTFETDTFSMNFSSYKSHAHFYSFSFRIHLMRIF